MLQSKLAVVINMAIIYYIIQGQLHQFGTWKSRLNAFLGSFFFYAFLDFFLAFFILLHDFLGFLCFFSQFSKCFLGTFVLYLI